MPKMKYAHQPLMLPNIKIILVQEKYLACLS